MIRWFRAWRERRRHAEQRRRSLLALGFANAAEWYAATLPPCTPPAIVATIVARTHARAAEYVATDHGAPRIIVRLRIRDRVWPPRRRRVEEIVRKAFYDSIPLGAAARIGLEIR